MPTPPSRRLVACAVALLVMLALTGLLFLTRRSFAGWMTPIGLIAPLDLLAVAFAMAAGGFIARRGFGIPAVALVVLIGIGSAIAAFAYAPAEQTGAARWLMRNTALQLVLSAIVAWAAAMVGERVAAIRR
ncbi:hypothetical protein [Lysobacter sp. HA35]